MENKKEILDLLYFCLGFIGAEIKFKDNTNLKVVLEKLDKSIDLINKD